MLDATQILKDRKVSIRNVKKHFKEKYPSDPFTAILISEPDELTIDQLLSKYETWISVLSNETTKKLADRINNEEVV